MNKLKMFSRIFSNNILKMVKNIFMIIYNQTLNFNDLYITNILINFKD